MAGRFCEGGRRGGGGGRTLIRDAARHLPSGISSGCVAARMRSVGFVWAWQAVLPGLFRVFFLLVEKQIVQICSLIALQICTVFFFFRGSNFY